MVAAISASSADAAAADAAASTVAVFAAATVAVVTEGADADALWMPTVSKTIVDVLVVIVVAVGRQ